jgi:predicted dithiol-disulfide oxidoreductase (DUF899 family)
MAAQCGTDPAGYLSERPVLNVFALAGGVIHHTYSTAARGLEVLMGYHGMLDRVPFGRNEPANPTCGSAAATSTRSR